MCVRYGGSMSIPLILASKSKPRRDLLFHAGICPTIRVSHVDEPGVIAKAAVGAGVSVDDLPIATKVMVLAQAKANAVYQAYKDVAEVSTNAHGDEVTGFPLEAAQSTADSAHTDDAQTRDFSGVQFPTRTRVDECESRPADSRLRFDVPARRQSVWQTTYRTDCARTA